MGHRANYVIVDRGEHRIHYSQFGALSLASDPLMGPEQLESYIGGPGGTRACRRGRLPRISTPKT
ncbi:hypothetical protein [Actinomadura fibrosa]|uniref:DUF5753 domain-containing protein n=1 Tax=Actinomadura fibrosa TaxID=111802 RepID=A0ABW2XPL9_9ACTN|nr:hypothetical protein [Actinomadura fibrosa]